MLIAQLISNPIAGFFFILSIVVAVTIHEFAHAKVADHLGDPTPESMGRVTLDPRAHLDVFGSILFLLSGFGWGKPVQFDPYNLQNPRRDTALIALAGPATNLVLALSSSLVLYLIAWTNQLSSVAVIVQILLETFVWVNVSLGIFNMLPFAPLDGFKIVGGMLSERQAHQWYELERYGIIFLLFFILPFSNGRSMLEIFVSPVIRTILGVLIPS